MHFKPVTEAEKSCLAAVDELLSDFDSEMAAETLQQKLAEAQGTEMEGQLSDVAEEVSSFFNEFMRLLNAKNDKDIEQLRAAISEIELRRIVEKLRVKYRAEKAAEQVNKALIESVEMRKKFDDVDEMKRKIAALKQSVISEIRSYGSPPEGIHQVMMATYLLLGQTENDIKVVDQILTLFSIFL